MNGERERERERERPLLSQLLCRVAITFAFTAVMPRGAVMLRRRWKIITSRPGVWDQNTPSGTPKSTLKGPPGRPPGRPLRGPGPGTEKGGDPATCGKAANVMPVHRIEPPGTPVSHGSRATPPLKLPPLIPFGDGLRNNSSSRSQGSQLRASVIEVMPAF